MREIRSVTTGALLARVIQENDWGGGLSFYSEESEYIQVGTWTYEAGKRLLAHKHKSVERSIDRTQEVVFVRKGKVQADIYDVDDEHLESVELKSGEFIILLSGGHGYTILEDQTEVVEVKNGPYPGADADRSRIEVSH